MSGMTAIGMDSCQNPAKMASMVTYEQPVFFLEERHWAMIEK